MNINEFFDGEGRLRKIFVVFFIFLTVHGTVGFMCFIFEESMQTAMFTAFAYQSAKDWDGLSEHIKLMEATHGVSEAFIVSVGWMAPVIWPAYLQYLKVNKGYILAMKKRVRVERRLIKYENRS